VTTKGGKVRSYGTTDDDDDDDEDEDEDDDDGCWGWILSDSLGFSPWP
jgi:hypothetical protein